MSRWLASAVLVGAVLGLSAATGGDDQTPAPAPAQPPPVVVAAPVDPAEAAWTPVRVASRNLAIITLQAIPLAALLGAAGWAVRRRDVWYAKDDGRMPFKGIDNEVARQALAGLQEAQLAEASQVLPVHTYAPNTTFAPHDTYSPRNHQSGQWVEPPAPVATVSVDKAPTWGDLVARGEIGPGRPLYLGWAPDKPLTGSWKSVYSAGIGGLAGSGKSWTAVSLILQALAGGARVYVVDPHDGDPESLGARLRAVEALLARPVASDPDDIRAVLEEIEGELERRIRGSGDRTPVLLAIDEHTALQRGDLGDVISLVIEAVNQEGRKLLVTCLLLGQSWSVQRTGGGDVRGTLTSAFVHRMPGATARQLTNLRAEELPRDTMQLAPGECYVVTTTGEITRVVTPRLTEADVAAFAALLTSSATSSRPVPNPLPTSSRQSLGTGAGDQSPISSATSSGDEDGGQGANDPQYGEVRAWVLEGVSYAEIKARLIGENVKRGRASQEANERITAILQAIALEALYAHGDTNS